jgi:RNA polymerase sigma factor (TIGR02999 family)
MNSPNHSPRTVTRLLLDWRDGDAGALGALMPLMYEELRRLARAKMRDQPAGHTLQPTALVHEAYARMVDLELDWQDRSHFLCMAARTMRRVLVDHARAARAAKRGAGAVQVTLQNFHAQKEASLDLLAIDQALESLSRQDQRAASAIELCYFGGLTGKEIAEALEVSAATAERDLRFARSWLKRELAGERSAGT